MPAYDVHGRTDAMNDPNYIRGLLGSPNPRIRAQGEAALRDLQARETHEQQLHEFEQREMDRQSNSEANRGVRQAAVDQNALAKEELNQRGQAAEGDKKTALMAHLLANPQALANLQGNTPDALVQRAIVDKMMKDAGVSATLPADPKMVALARSKGLAEPQGTVLGGGGTQTAPQAPTGGASPTPPALFGPEGSSQANVINTLKAAGQPYVEGGSVHNQPAGTANQDYNVSTGEWMPSNLVGTINGRPAGQVIAEGAQRTGIAPESPSGTHELARLTGIQKGLAGGNPAPNENMTAQPMFSPSNLAKNAPTPSTPPHMVQGGPAKVETPTEGGPNPYAGVLPALKSAGGAVASGYNALARGYSQGPNMEHLAALNEKAGHAGDVLSNPFSAAAATGGLFSGGQGGVGQLVGHIPAAVQNTGPSPMSNPTPGIAPLAGGPVSPPPALTPPAIPPVKKLTPQEQQMAFSQ